MEMAQNIYHTTYSFHLLQQPNSHINRILRNYGHYNFTLFIVAII